MVLIILHFSWFYIIKSNFISYLEVLHVGQSEILNGLLNFEANIFYEYLKLYEHCFSFLETKKVNE
jgi:hypothetical protein